MGVYEICAESDVAIRPVPSGTVMPAAATPTGEDIQTLSEIGWALTALQQSLEVSSQIRGIIGQPGETGALRPETWAVWGQVTTELTTRTGIAATALPFERIVQAVIAQLEGQQNPANNGDLVRLREALRIYTQFLTGFRQALTGGDHSLAGGVTYAEDRSFRYNIQNILVGSDGRSGLMAHLHDDGLRTAINIGQINWTAPQISVSDVGAVLGRVTDRAQMERLCNTYAEFVPPEPQVVSPPPPPQPRRLDYSVSVIPAADVSFTGQPVAPQLSGEAAGWLRLSEHDSLLAYFRGLIDMQSFADFGISRDAQDTGVIQWRHGDWVTQGTYTYNYDSASDQGRHLGALGASRSFLDDLLAPFLGIIGGASRGSYEVGGYGGVRTSYFHDGRGLARFGVNGQVRYSLLYSGATEEVEHQVSGQAAVIWQPVSGFQVGVSLVGGWSSATERGGIVPGLILGWGNPRLTPMIQTVYAGGF